MITSNSDTFGIFGLKILKISDCSVLNKLTKIEFNLWEEM